MLKAVIYDLDGTLIDSRADLAGSVNAALAALGLPPLREENVIASIGGGAERLMRRSLVSALGAGLRDPGALDADLLRRGLAAWNEDYSQRLLDKTRLYPGIAELLELPPAARAVLTNKPGKYARRIVEGLGLESKFAKVLGGDEVAKKPDPGALLSLCETLGAQPEEALLIGDMTIDIETGAAAGIGVCAVSWGLAPRADLVAASPKYLVDSAGQLARLLGELSA